MGHKDINLQHTGVPEDPNTPHKPLCLDSVPALEANSIANIISTATANMSFQQGYYSRPVTPNVFFERIEKFSTSCTSNIPNEQFKRVPTINIYRTCLIVHKS